jgi:site-specific DNA-methyltransferase (adenine-specific)
MLNLPQNPKWDIARVSHSTLVNADCFDVFPFIESKSIDLICTDLPYGTTQNKWDSVLDLNKLWEQYKRIIKDNCPIVLFAQTPFDKVLGCSNLSWLKYEWIWDKKLGSGSLNVKKMPLKRHENILVFGNGKITYNPQMRNGKYRNKSTSKPNANKGNYGLITHQKDNFNDEYYPTSILEYSNANVRARLHPTEKNLELTKYLISTYSNENDMVLDNTMGSGTTNLACLKLNRKSIGIEKEKQYYNVAVRRLSSYCG